MRSSSARVIGLLVLALVGGCGDSGGGSGGAGGTGGGETGGGGSAGGTNNGGGDAGGGGPCGEAAVACAEGKYCSWHYGSCGQGNSVDFAECIDVTTGCAPDGDPVCACDGQIYESHCAAAAQGVDVGQKGDCIAPEGFFLCGSYLCKTGEDYCHLNDIIDAVNATCKPLGGCTDCECLLPGGQGGGGNGSSPTCTCAAASDHLTVSCEGGGI